MATLIEAELKQKLLAPYIDNNISGDLVNMLASFSARFLYLEQFSTAGIVLEGSFSRSVRLNSRITHAADNFYSVPRGKNRLVQLRNVYVLESISANKFDIISTYGDYKLVYAKDYSLVASNNAITIDCYLSLDSMTEEIQGNDLLFMDLAGKNISEDIIIYDKDYPLEKFNVIRDISKLPEEDDPSTVVAITQPDYSVRLWRNVPFETNKTYVIKYLRCPDPNIEPLDLAQIVSIPKIRYSPSVSSGASQIVEVSAATNPVTRLDEIYLYTQSKVKYGDNLKSLDQFITDVKQYFPEFTGFNVMSQITEGTNTLYVYYVTNPDEIEQDTSYMDPEEGEPANTSPNYMRVQAFRDMEKTYFITSNIKFVAAEVYNPFNDEEASDSASDDSDENPSVLPLTVDVHIKESLRYDIVESIVRGYQSKVGKPWNPFQLISDLMSDETVGPFIKYVEMNNEVMFVKPLYNEDTEAAEAAAGRRVMFDLTLNYKEG